MPIGARALTGPQAAALYGLDGYRDLDWPVRWCAPSTCRPQPGVVRTRRWEDPVLIGDTPVAPVHLVLHHLADVEHHAPDGLALAERVELAVEHALRSRLVALDDLAVRGRGGPGDGVLRDILRVRGGEPPTESFAETRAAQLLRSTGLVAWRQVFVVDGPRIVHRADFAVPFQLRARLRRPEPLLPHDGLIIEIDGRGLHEPQFERDHRRGSTYDRLGYRWISLTPTQIEHTPADCVAAVAGALGSGRRARP